MAISESYDFNLDRDGIISKAYVMVGAVAIGEDPTAAEITEGSKTLNLMLKGWQTEGIGLWLNQKIDVSVTTSTKSYDLGAAIPRPLQIIEGKRITSGVETSLLQITRSEYLSIRDKTTTGTISKFYYDPQLTTGVLYVYPPSDNSTDTLEFTIKKPISDFDASTDDGEFPPEWLDAVVMNLAVRVSIENGIEISQDLKELAIASKALAKEFDIEKDTPSYDPALDRGQLISEAYKLAGVTQIGSDPTIDELLDGITSLNSMLHGWQTEGIGLWLNKKIEVSAVSGSKSYDLGAAIPRPLFIIEGKRITSGVETPLLQITRSEYLSIQDKTTSGTTSQFYYDPQLITGILYVWPPSDNATDTFEFTIKQPMTDFDADVEDGEFPPEWRDAVITNLAVRISIKKGAAVSPDLKELALTSKALAKEFDVEKDRPSYDPALDRGNLISEAYRLAGVTPIGVDPTIEELLDGISSLNSMLRSWQTEEIGLWLNQKITVFLAPDTKSYSLGLTGDNASATTIKTGMKVAGEASDGTIDVDSIIGVSSGDYIGIELDDGTLQWTTINGAPSGDTITLSSNLTGASAIENHVYTYTTKTDRPLRIIDALRVDSDGITTPLLISSRSEYMLLSNKATTGVVTQIYYDPQLTNGVLYVWPTCDNVKYTIELTVKVPVTDFDASNSTGEVPPEWRDAIVSNLALRIAMKQAAVISSDRKYINFNINPSLKQFAAESKFMAQSHDDEKEPFFFQPSYR